ncbi:MAG: hypothetical protein AAGA96_09910, partial [Verrucomicrobiota bacterium]
SANENFSFRNQFFRSMKSIFLRGLISEMGRKRCLVYSPPMEGLELSLRKARKCRVKKIRGPLTDPDQRPPIGQSCIMQ